jgi:hypothetical protein
MFNLITWLSDPQVQSKESVRNKEAHQLLPISLRILTQTINTSLLEAGLTLLRIVFKGFKEG